MTRKTLMCALALATLAGAACEQRGIVVDPSYKSTAPIDAEEAALRERADQRAGG